MRRQLPAYSPLSLGTLARAFADAVSSPRAAREALRRYLAERFGATHVVLTASGTEALRLALELATAARPSREARVALPAYSCYDVLTAAVGADVEPLFYDIDPVSLSPDMESVARVVDSGATAVVAGNLFGFPLEWDGLRAQCDRSGAILVEDAAQGLGSGWASRAYGSFGDLTVLSFGRGKGWTGGGGGALLVHVRLGDVAMSRLDEVVLRRARSGASAKIPVACAVQWAIGRPSLYGLAAAVPGTGLGETRYKEPTRVAGMPAFCASAVVGHADSLDAQTAVRRRSAAVWDAMLAAERDGKLTACRPLDADSCGYLRYPCTAEGRAAADALCERAGALGVARGYPSPLPRLPAAARISPCADAIVPGAAFLADALVTLPTHGWVEERDVESVRELIR